MNISLPHLLILLQDFYIYDAGNPLHKFSFSYIVKVGNQLWAVRRGRGDSCNPNFDESMGDSFPDNSDISRARAITKAYSRPTSITNTDKRELEEQLSVNHRVGTAYKPELIDWKHYFQYAGSVTASIFGFIDGRLLLGWEDVSVVSFVLQSMKHY